MRHLMIAALLLLILPSPALAGVVFEIETTYHSGSSPTPAENKMKVKVRWSWTEGEEVTISDWNLRSRTTGTWRTVYNGPKASTELDDLRPGVPYDVRVRGNSEEDGWTEWSEIWTLQCELMLDHTDDSDTDDSELCTITPLDINLD